MLSDQTSRLALLDLDVSPGIQPKLWSRAGAPRVHGEVWDEISFSSAKHNKNRSDVNVDNVRRVPSVDWTTNLTQAGPPR